MPMRQCFRQFPFIREEHCAKSYRAIFTKPWRIVEDWIEFMIERTQTDPLAAVMCV